jgi:hypothetical protein
MRKTGHCVFAFAFAWNGDYAMMCASTHGDVNALFQGPIDFGYAAISACPYDRASTDNFPIVG